MSEDCDYPVRAINNCRYSPGLDKFQWYVEWEPESSDAEVEETWEPLEGILSCPLLVSDYEKDVLKSLSEKDISEGRRKPPIEEFLQSSEQTMEKKLMASEFIPSGKEYVLKIYSTWKTKVQVSIPTKKRNVKKKIDVQYFLVKFYSDDGLHRIVRRPYMEYYFPTTTMTFLLK